MACCEFESGTGCTTVDDAHNSHDAPLLRHHEGTGEAGGEGTDHQGCGEAAGGNFKVGGSPKAGGKAGSAQFTRHD